MKQIDKKQINKVILSSIVILFVLSIVPIIILGRYGVMCIDDYNYGIRVHDRWIETGSFIQAAQTAWQQSMDVYQNWEGTYASNFLWGMCPMNFYYGIAWVVPILMIGTFSVSTFVIGRQIMCKWMGVDKVYSSLVMFVLLFMYYQVIEAPFEGIYWYNGASHYILMQSLWFLTLTLISAGLWTDSKPKEVVYCAGATVMAVIIGGGNLITCLQAEIVMVLLIIYAAFTNRKKLMLVVLPFVTGSTGFLFNALAPGNSMRAEPLSADGYSAVKSILLSFYHAICSIVRWTPAIVIVIWLALLPVLCKIVKQSDKSFRHPMWITIGAFCVFSAMFTPTLFVFGMTGYSRMDNIIQMVYYLCLIMVTTYWLGYISHWKRDEVFCILLEKSGIRITVACFIIAFVIFIFTGDKNTYTSISALRSLINGDAQTFYAEAMERHDIYTDDTVTNVEIKPYSTKPALFDYEDLSDDTGYWLNLAVAEYFHKESVKVVDDEMDK